MCPFSILAFSQPTTVDKEPIYLTKFFSLFIWIPYEACDKAKDDG